MVSPTSSRLLTIPREIRDEVYKYLYHEVSHRYLYLNSSGTRIRTLNVKLANAPILNLLLTHSRIYEEYAKAPSFHNLQATITYNMSFQDAWFEEDDATLPDQTKVESALAQVCCLTAIFRSMSEDSCFLWDDAELLLTDKLPCMPHLSTIRVIHSASLDDYPFKILEGLETTALSEVLEHLESPDNNDKAVPVSPTTLGSLTLQQKARGMFFDCFGIYKIDDVAMTSSETFGFLSPMPIPANLRATMGELDAAKASMLLSQMREWEDVRRDGARRQATIVNGE